MNNNGGSPSNTPLPPKPKLRRFYTFLRNCKVVRKYDLDTYYLIYLMCGNEMVVLNCSKDNQCIETVRVKVT